jgi:hypothetical protein
LIYFFARLALHAKQPEAFYIGLRYTSGLLASPDCFARSEASMQLCRPSLRSKAEMSSSVAKTPKASEASNELLCFYCFVFIASSCYANPLHACLACFIAEGFLPPSASVAKNA